MLTNIRENAKRYYLASKEKDFAGISAATDAMTLLVHDADRRFNFGLLEFTCDNFKKNYAKLERYPLLVSTYITTMSIYIDRHDIWGPVISDPVKYALEQQPRQAGSGRHKNHCRLSKNRNRKCGRGRK
jgi:hypothetical protein